MILTLRQLEVLNHLKECGVVRSETDGSVLRALQAKGLVAQHHNNNGCGGVYYTWTLTARAEQETFQI